MRYLSIIIISAILSGTVCIKACADVSYADLFLNGRGYKPAEEAQSEKLCALYSQENNNLPDNPLYREWCINTFNNGEQIYKAYKEIAFDIDYRAEPPKTDYWQTPGETIQSKQGDCEDSVFLFFSQLPELNTDGDIVWGWIMDKNSSIAFAHVWYQLYDKHGKPYIVEGFSKEWNGIIPAGSMNGTEERIPILMLKHNQVSHVVDEMIPKFTESSGDTQFSWDIYFNNATIIRDIFQKLQDLFNRYRR